MSHRVAAVDRQRVHTLGYGGLLLLGGRAADLARPPPGVRRRGVAVFAAVSLLGGFVSSPGLLIAARIIKGMAAAFTAPASMSLLTTTFPEGPLRNRALSIYSRCSARAGSRSASCCPACSPRSAGG